MYRVLLVDQDTNHAERLALCLRQRGLAVSIADSIPESARLLRQRIPVCDLVLVAVAEMSDRWLDTLLSLIEASRQLHFSLGPLFLLASRQNCNPHFRLRIERLGVRYVCA
jgi:ActR/RegA family two-component response regulator